VAYLHVAEPGVNGTLSASAHLESPYLGSRFFRPLFSRTIIAAGGHTARTGGARIERGDADLIAYGKLFISNPTCRPGLPPAHRSLNPTAPPSTAAGPRATPTTRPWPTRPAMRRPGPQPERRRASGGRNAHP
jgi:N-ethylmaleimide reductase